MSDKILADPSDLTGAGTQVVSKVTDASDLTSTIQWATTGVAGGLSGISALSSVDTELEELQRGVTTIMNCLTDSLTLLGNGLQNAAQEFKTTDSQLANMFYSLEESLQPFTGFEGPPIVQPPPPPPPPAAKPKKKGKSWWGRTLNIVGGVGLLAVAGLSQVAGGGPEDPLADAATVEAGEEGLSLIGAGL